MTLWTVKSINLFSNIKPAQYNRND